MNQASLYVLRVGIAITFLWIGVLTLKNPEAWGGFIQPWLRDILPFSPASVALATAFFNFFVGILLLIDYYLWFAALLASIYLFLVLLASGINAITIRDIGLLSAALALFLTSFPSQKLK